MFKVFCLAVVLAVASARPQESHGHGHENHVDYYAVPKYSFEYKVVDPHTHDSKYHQETRHHDTVKGVYSVYEPDGTIRIVEYVADKHGFNANVKQEGLAKHTDPEDEHH